MPIHKHRKGEFPVDTVARCMNNMLMYLANMDGEKRFIADYMRFSKAEDAETRARDLIFTDEIIIKPERYENLGIESQVILIKMGESYYDPEFLEGKMADKTMLQAIAGDIMDAFGYMREMDKETFITNFVKVEKNEHMANHLWEKFEGWPYYKDRVAFYLGMDHNNQVVLHTMVEAKFLSA